MTPSQSNTAISSASPDSLSFVGTIALGAYHVVLAVFLMIVLYVIWPGMLTKDGEGLTQTIQLFGEMKFHIRPDVRWILLVMVVSALGSFVHSAASFADYVGNQRINKSWVWYYLLRVPIGVALALVFYFAIRGGLISPGASSDVLSPYGIAAISGLVGMFSKQATDKLEELFSTLFKTTKDKERQDKLTEKKEKDKTGEES